MTHGKVESRYRRRVENKHELEKHVGVTWCVVQGAGWAVTSVHVVAVVLLQAITVVGSGGA